jgi:holin-like protein
MRGLAILLGFNLLGALLQAARVPLPGNVIGLILFTACLFLGIVKLEWVEESAHFLLRHMLLFFAPAVIAAIPLFRQFGNDWAAIGGSLVGSLLVVLLVTGWVATWLIPRGEREVALASGYESNSEMEAGDEPR